MKDWWNSRDKETAAYALAFIIVTVWLTLIFLNHEEAPTLTNVIMIIIGYIYGSSTGSKRKDDAFIPPAPNVGSMTSETTTKIAASTADATSTERDHPVT